MASVGTVKVPGGFIGQEDGGLHHESARDRHPLLFASRKLCRIVVMAIQQPHPIQQLTGTIDSAVDSIPKHLRRQENVFHSSQCREQLVGLEDETHLPSADRRQFVLAEIGNFDPIDRHRPRGRPVQTGQHPQQRALAATRGPHECNDLRLRDLKAEVSENLDPVSRRFDGFDKVFDNNHGYADLIRVSVSYTIVWTHVTCVNGPLDINKMNTRQLLALVITLSWLGSAAACTSQPDEANLRPVGPDPVTFTQTEVDPNVPVILAFGDSLTFGSGVDRALTYPSQLQAELDRRGYTYRVVNQGVSGDTTSGGIARLEGALALEPEIVILELGGNDGLRGIPVDVARENLRTMIKAFNEVGSRVILAGMSLPLNYGPDYISSFESIYADLTQEHDIVLIPFFLEGLVEEYERYMQADGIHPTSEGYTIVVDTVLETIEPYLTE